MGKKEPENCWEYWNCPKEITTKCPAYIENSGRDCVLLAEGCRPFVKRDFENCWECPWYKITHPNDEK